MNAERLSDRLIQKMEHVYQPIWNVDTLTIFGYEALIRFPDMPFGNDLQQAFALARDEGMLYELDTKAIINAISQFPFHQLDTGKLFLNIFPSTLLIPHFRSFITMLVEKYPHIQGKAVFEINEDIGEEVHWDHPLMKERIHLIKRNGFTIALDDIGQGGAGLRKMIEFSPDYIKLDRYFSEKLSVSKEKQQMISLLLQYANHKMGVILEGIEKVEELDEAMRIHVPIVQGYLLGKPQHLSMENPTDHPNDIIPLLPQGFR